MLRSTGVFVEILVKISTLAGFTDSFARLSARDCCKLFPANGFSLMIWETVSNISPHLPVEPCYLLRGHQSPSCRQRARVSPSLRILIYISSPDTPPRVKGSRALEEDCRGRIRSLRSIFHGSLRKNQQHLTIPSATTKQTRTTEKQNILHPPRSTTCPETTVCHCSTHEPFV